MVGYHFTNERSRSRSRDEGGSTLDRLIRCFDRTSRRFSDEQKRILAELVIRHGHRGLTFTVKVMKDHGLIAQSTYDRDCIGVRRALAELRTLNGAKALK